jgi:hypothetical protein
MELRYEACVRCRSPMDRISRQPSKRQPALLSAGGRPPPPPRPPPAAGGGRGRRILAAAPIPVPWMPGRRLRRLVPRLETGLADSFLS